MIGGSPTRDAAIKKIDKKIGDLWRAHRPGTCTAADYARLWRQIDALLDKRLTFAEVDSGA